MKEILLPWGRWIVAGALLLALGLLILTGLGRKRGTRLYRVRINLWSVILGLAAAGGVLVGSATLGGCRTCYKPMPNEPDKTAAENGGTDAETTVTVETTEMKEDESGTDSGQGGTTEDKTQPTPVVAPSCYSAPLLPPLKDQPPLTGDAPEPSSTPATK
jgi:hypothetical protein